jgi:hypothetical protein
MLREFTVATIISALLLPVNCGSSATALPTQLSRSSSFSPTGHRSIPRYANADGATATMMTSLRPANRLLRRS